MTHICTGCTDHKSCQVEIYKDRCPCIKCLVKVCCGEYCDAYYYFINEHYYTKIKGKKVD